MVESAMSMGFFMFLTLLGLELLRVSFSALSIQYAVNRAAHYAAVTTTYSELDRESAIRNRLIEYSFVPIDAESIHICPAALNHCEISNAGGPGDWFSVQVTQLIPLAFGITSIPLSARSFSKNEFWPSS